MTSENPKGRAERKARRAEIRELRRVNRQARQARRNMESSTADAVGVSGSKPACVLHVGTLKTGSTAIQQAMWHNRERLAAAGYCVPAPLNTQGGRFACLFSEDFKACRAYKLYFESEREFESERLQKLESVTRLSRRRAGDTFLLSAEQFCQFSDREVSEFGRWLGERFFPIRVVLYLRAPHDYLTSLYSTQLFHGRTEPFFLPKWAQDFSEAVRRYASVFGAENVTVRAFDRGILAGGDVVQDFMDVIGAGAVELEPAGGDDNPSISGEAQECLRQLNLVFRARGLDNVKDVLNFGLRTFLQETFPGRGFQPAADEVRDFIDRNRDVYENYSRVAGGYDFTASLKKYPEAGTVLSMKDMQATAGRLMPFLAAKLRADDPDLYVACHERLAPWIIRIE